MDIRHNEKEHKFFVNIEGQECALKYRALNERLWNFEKTIVPEKASEKGLLEQIIGYAIDFVRNHNIKILVSCVDVQDFLIKHKNFKNLVYHPY